jgi:hypothetical protein
LQYCGEIIKILTYDGEKPTELEFIETRFLIDEWWK